MKLDELKNLWKSQQQQLADDYFDEALEKLQSKMSKFDKTIFRRDMIEAAAASFVIVFFVWFAATNDLPVPAVIGICVIVLGAIEIVVVMALIRNYGLPQAASTLRDHFKAEVAKVDRQIFLLRNVNWWYSGPILVGCVIFAAGIVFQEIDAQGVPPYLTWGIFGGMCATFFLVGWMAYRMNQHAVRTHLLPLRKELTAIYESLCDETQLQDSE